MKIFFSVGEPSGDLHGANLIRQLRQEHPNICAVGYGGPKMAAAGCQLHADLTQLAVMWFARALLNLHRFLLLLVRADRYFRQERPDAVVLIDYPGFNWWIARRAKARGIPVFYYGTPQLWAWASWRVEKMKRFVDHVLCKLPFEVDWYRKQGVQANYVGHPYFDHIQHYQPDAEFLLAQKRHYPLVTILPGSRTQEVMRTLPFFLKAAQLVRKRAPHVRIAVACFSEQHAAIARQMMSQQRVLAEVHVGRTLELIQAADCCMACSGSVSLELLYYTKPTVILYHVSRFAYAVQKRFRRSKYITLVNLLASPLLEQHQPEYDPDAPGAEPVPMPEYLTWEDKSPQIADHVIRWLTDSNAHAASCQWLAELRQQYALPGASQAAARYILRELGASSTAPAPHFQTTPVRSKI